MFFLTEVTSPQHKRDFLQLPFTIYNNDSNWIPPLKQDIEKVFNPEKNNFFKHGECVRWILQDENQIVVGRIAAFINNNTAFNEEQPTGGCGFFECVNDQEAAFTLFGAAQKWLAQRGMQAMDGPINFGERNAWWGLLIEGFTSPTYQMNYNPPYYKALFEAYGFQDYFQQYSYSLNVHDQRPERYRAIVERLNKSGDYTYQHATKRDWKKYAEDFRSVYNRTWKFLPNFKEMSSAQAIAMFKSFKPVMIDYLAWFAYYKNEPIAIFIMLPELNGWFRHVNGNLNLWGMLKFLWLKTFDTGNRKIFGIVFGVVPEFQKKGVEASLVLAADKVVRSKKRWDEIELTWVGDFNIPMTRTCEALGGKIVKRHVTYRKLFNEDAIFKRHPVIE